MRGIFRAIARALRAVMRRLKATAAWGAGLVDSAWASLFGGGGYVDEVVEDATTMSEDVPSAQETHEAIARPAVADFSPAVLVKRAVEMRSANQPIEGVFDLGHPEQKRLYLYVKALDECGLRAIRHMPPHTLARHLDVTDFCAAGLRQVDRTIIMAREAAEARAAAVAAKANVPSPRRRRSPSANAIAEANASGRQLTIGELVAATRRAAAA